MLSRWKGLSLKESRIQSSNAHPQNLCNVLIVLFGCHEGKNTGKSQESHLKNGSYTVFQGMIGIPRSPSNKKMPAEFQRAFWIVARTLMSLWISCLGFERFRYFDESAHRAMPCHHSQRQAAACTCALRGPVACKGSATADRQRSSAGQCLGVCNGRSVVRCLVLGRIIFAFDELMDCGPLLFEYPKNFQEIPKNWIS